MDWMYGDNKTVSIGLVIWMFVLIPLMNLGVNLVFYRLGWFDDFWVNFFGFLPFMWGWLIAYFLLGRYGNRGF